MKHFVYTIKTSRRDANGNQKKRADLWLIKNNTPGYLGHYVYYTEGEGQAVAKLALHVKAIPRRYKDYETIYRLQNEGVATFHSMSF